MQAYDLAERPLSSEVLVVVYVVDQNDHAPQFDRALYRKAIPEDTPPGTSVTQVGLAARLRLQFCARACVRLLTKITFFCHYSNLV